MIDSSHCEGCPLQGISSPAEPTGTPDGRFMLVTDTPFPSVALDGRLLSKRHAKVLATAAESAEFSRGDFYIVPQIRCPHQADEYSSAQKKQIKKRCREHLLDEIAQHQPEVVIPLGGEAASQVQGRGVKITKVRGVAEYSEEHGTMVLPMLSLPMVANYPQHEPTFAADWQTLRRVVDNGYDVERASGDLLGEYTVIDDLQFLIDKKPKILFFDLETTGIEYFHKGEHSVREYNPHVHGKRFDPDAAILTMHFCVEPGKAYMLVWDHPENPISWRRRAVVKKQLAELLCNPETQVIGQNSKYDASFVLHHLGILYRIAGDTLMMEALLDENNISKNQDSLVKKYVPEMAGYADHFNATYDKSRMWEVPLDKLIDYGCGDVDSGYLLYEALMEHLSKDKKLLNHYMEVSLPGINAFVLLEQRGLDVDERALLDFEQLMATSVEAQYRSLISQVPRSIKRKHIDAGLSFSRADFVLDILFRHRDGLLLTPKVFTKGTAKLPPDMRIPSVSTKDHLPYFYDDYPFVLELANYIKDERLLSTNVRGFKKKYIHDGKVRPSYSLARAVTGRTASENPNGQNFPKRGANATAYRRIYIAPAGYYVLEADFSQAELRIAADMAREPTMLGIYRSGGDIHKRTALIVMGVTQAEFDALPKGEQKAARQKAKAVNFGFIYGMGWRKFIGYAKTQYGVEFTEEEARRIRSAFFATYNRLEAWHERVREYAQEHGMVRSYSGRVRHLPMIYSDEEYVQQEAGRQAINSPVQEFGSSLGVQAMARLSEEIDERYLAPIAFVHDAIYCLVPEKYLEWGAKTLQYYMESNPIEEVFGIKMRCPIVADVSFGRNLGDTYELAGLRHDSNEEYDFSSVWGDKEPAIVLPRQRIPANSGRRIQELYTNPYA